MALNASEDKSGDLRVTLEKLLPGKSAGIRGLREDVRSLCENFMATAGLLLGPVGCGKSTVARVIALLRLLSLLKPDQRSRLVSNIRFDGPMRIDKRMLNFYAEYNLTGLSPTLVDAQLFGIEQKVATGVAPREGVFENVSHGHGRTKANATEEAQLTEGVVLLDEIGDMDRDLQPKLLTVLTGAHVHRVGGEVTSEGFSFRGLTLCATWRDPHARRPDDTEYIRPDILSRLNEHEIRIPSLNDRPEDIADIVSLQLVDLDRRLNERADALARLRYEKAGIDVSRLDGIRTNRVTVSEADILLLQQRNWARSGELRGLRQILERALLGNIPLAAALERQPFITSSPPERQDGPSVAAAVLDIVLKGSSPRPTLSGRFNDAESELRRQVQRLLLNDAEELARCARSLGCDLKTLRKQVSELIREDRASDTPKSGDAAAG